MTALAPHLLSGKSVVTLGVSDAVSTALTELGARVEVFNAEAERAGSVDAIVYDAGVAFGDGGQAGLRDSQALGWSAIRDVAAGTLIPQGGGKVVVIAPPPGAGTFAEAACAALENLVRTLSIEWARYAITATAIAPGNATTDDQLAELVCFLVSPAGDYFSGCRFSLGVAAPAG